MWSQKEVAARGNRPTNPGSPRIPRHKTRISARKLTESEFIIQIVNPDNSSPLVFNGIEGLKQIKIGGWLNLKKKKNGWGLKLGSGSYRRTFQLTEAGQIFAAGMDTDVKNGTEKL